MVLLVVVLPRLHLLPKHNSCTDKSATRARREAGATSSRAPAATAATRNARPTAATVQSVLVAVQARCLTRPPRPGTRTRCTDWTPEDRPVGSCDNMHPDAVATAGTFAGTWRRSDRGFWQGASDHMKLTEAIDFWEEHGGAQSRLASCREQEAGCRRRGRRVVHVLLHDQ